MAQHSIELISFDLCPFVQRSVITLLYKNVDHTIEYIDLANKPEWFLKISPTGKVPVLKYNKEHILFESAVINEFLDEITEGSLLPQDPLEKAKMRAYIEFSSTLLMNNYTLCMAKEKEKFEEALETLKKSMARIEEVLPGGDYFNGKSFSLMDAAIAPFLVRLKFITKRMDWPEALGFEKIKKLSDSLTTKDYVLKSAIPNLEEKYVSYLKMNGTYIGQAF